MVRSSATQLANCSNGSFCRILSVMDKLLNTARSEDLSLELLAVLRLNGLISCTGRAPSHGVRMLEVFIESRKLVDAGFR
jgi:hypothetical protein